MAMSNFLQANVGYYGSWFNLPTPSDYRPTYTHLENSTRDANGNLHRDIKRYNLAKITCGWEHLNNEEMALLQSLYDHDSFRLRFTDNKGQRVEKLVYAGPLDGKTMYANKENYLMTKRNDVTMNFIEV